MSTYTLRRGQAPLILSMPHAGTSLPDDVAQGLVSPWLARKDTDWHIPALYDFAGALDATILAAELSRTVIDLNRDPSGASLYPGQFTTGLCPAETFDGEPLYAGAPPDTGEVARRRASYFNPYHDTLAAEIARLRGMHARVVLLDCHSIRSRIPRLFEGELPQLNIGTNDGQSCAPALVQHVADICAASGFSWVLNGRFKGGWITRHYGAPDKGVHALQLELAQRGYMPEPERMTPDNWPAPMLASPPIRPLLHAIVKGFCP